MTEVVHEFIDHPSYTLKDGTRLPRKLKVSRDQLIIILVLLLKLSMENLKHNFASEFNLARRSTYLRINLDTILNNINILKQKCSRHTSKV